MEEKFINTYDDTKIEIYEKLSISQILFLCLIIFIIAYTQIMEDHYFNNKYIFSEDNIILFVAIIALTGIFIYRILDIKEYISYFLINNYEIKIAHKVKNGISRIQTINKKHIKNFFINATVNFDHRRTYVKYDLLIELAFNEKISHKQLNANNKEFIFKLLEYSSEIPNFKLNVESNSETFKEEVDSYKNTKERFNIIQQRKMHFEGMSPSVKIFIFITIAFFILIFASVM